MFFSFNLFNFIFKNSKSKNELFEYFFQDYSRSESLNLFETIKNKSECIFSKRADLLGSEIWNENLTIEENVNK